MQKDMNATSETKIRKGFTGQKKVDDKKRRKEEDVFQPEYSIWKIWI